MTEARLLAAALYQLRILLAPLASADADDGLKTAERLSYALHNDALAVMDGKSFDCEAALARIERMIGGEEGRLIAAEFRKAISN
jgi:hypothetical protein